MPLFERTKRVTDPLDDRVKDRIVGRDRWQPVYVSSGSEHSGDGGDDPLNCFLHGGDDDDGDGGGGCNANDDDEGKEVDSDSECESDRTDAVIENLISILRNQNVDRFRNMLLANVMKSVELFHSLKPNKQILNRNVMLFLQKNGYNAAICKTKWLSCGGLTGGSYEFIDVIRSDSGDRYYIDLSFSNEFEIARETNQFRRISNYLPEIFIGKTDDLKQIVKLISDAARRSLKSRGLLLPPWRKNRFMQNKWFGSYRRTVNYTPATVTASISSASSAVKCRSIGFNAVSNVNGNGGGLFPAATCTR